MYKSHFLRMVRHHVLLCGLACLGIVMLAGCGRPDVPTSAAEPTADDAVAEPTVLHAAGEQPLPPTTSVAYPFPTTEIESVPGPIIPDYPAPMPGVVVDEQNHVVDVPTGGTADIAGVQVGDTLIALDDIPFAKERKKIKQHLSTKERGTEMTLTYERNGQEKQLKLTPNTVPLTLPAPDAPTPTFILPPYDFL